jgi:hypothetical protein
MKRKNPIAQAAQALGRMAKGKPKNYSPEEIAKRTERIRKYNANRKPSR